MSESDTKSITEMVKVEFEIWISGRKNLTVNDIQSLRVKIREEKFNLASSKYDFANQVWFCIYQRITDELERILGKNIWDAVMAIEKENRHLINLEPVIKGVGEAEMSNPVTTLLNKIVNIFMQER